jgi:hypothetical protein
MGEKCVAHEKNKNEYKILAGNARRKGPLGIRRYSWEENKLKSF